MEKVKGIVPVRDYPFRYDRGAFQTGRQIFTYLGRPFIYVLLWLFDTVSGTKVKYHGPHESGLEKDNLVQDVARPMSQVSKFVEWVVEAFRMWPDLSVDGEKRSINP